jgi:class 3 adenylate cyclase
VLGHVRYLVERVARHRGGVVKTMGDAIMAAFPTGADAAKAAREMQAGWEAFRRGKGAPDGVLLKVGAHQGPAIAIRNDGRLDYFGTTVNTAARAQGMAAGGEIVLTRALAEDPAVRPALEGLRREDFQAELKGLAGLQDLVRLSLVE